MVSLSLSVHWDRKEDDCDFLHFLAHFSERKSISFGVGTLNKAFQTYSRQRDQGEENRHERDREREGEPRARPFSGPHAG